MEFNKRLSNEPYQIITASGQSIYYSKASGWVHALFDNVIEIPAGQWINLPVAIPDGYRPKMRVPFIAVYGADVMIKGAITTDGTISVYSNVATTNVSDVFFTISYPV